MPVVGYQDLHLLSPCWIGRWIVVLTSIAIQEVHLQTVTEVLQSIKASDMSPMLQRIYASDGGRDALDVLMKYLYVCASSEPTSSLLDHSITVLDLIHVTGTRACPIPPRNRTSHPKQPVEASHRCRVGRVAVKIVVVP